MVVAISVSSLQWVLKIWQRRRSKGFFFTPETYREKTFNIEDVFDNETLVELRNSSLYHVTETNSLFYGRCFTICYLKKVDTATKMSFYRF